MDDGSERWTEIVASPIWDSYGHVTEVIELVRDVSENKKLQKEALRANRELLALNSIARALTQSLDLRVTLQAVAEAMLDALEAQVSWVRLSDDSGNVPAVQASRGLSVETLDRLIEAMSNRGSSEQTTSASYSVVSTNSSNGGQTLWQFAVTPLKSKGIELGIAGVATTKRPLDQQRIQLLDAIGNQITVAVERCRLYEEVQLTRDLRGELLRQVIIAQEEERKRIARELHDETGQTLTALRLNLERLAIVPVSNIEESKTQLARCLSLCQQADEEVDKLIFDLRPALLDDLGLAEAIKFYAETRLKTAGIELSLRVTGKEKRLSGEREVALFRVAQEAITNIVRHAHAKSTTIQLQFKTSQLVARIEDDGCGFEVSQTVNSHGSKRGLGLLGMRERISLVGGSLSIISKQGVGTHLKAVVPLDQEGAQR
jgi:signal transduction histidine kinase